MGGNMNDYNSFREYVYDMYDMCEALKIVKKKSDQSSQNAQTNQKRPRESKGNFEKKIDISYFDNVQIVRSNHTKETRNGELVPRDEGLRDAIILKAVKKAWKKGLKPKTKTMITYKNKKKKYDMIVVDWQKSQNKIILVTSIQDAKDSPRMYFGPSHKNDPQIMTESYNEIIMLDEDF